MPVVLQPKAAVVAVGSPIVKLSRRSAKRACSHRVGINRHPEMTSGFQVLPEFTVVQHQRDIQLLHALKKFFGCGVVRTNHAERMAYRVRSLDHLNQRIIPFFEEHPLKSKKRVDFVKFRKVLQLMTKGEHLAIEGIEKIRAIAATMNTGSER